MRDVKELKLVIQPKVIDHLGIKMYQKPVDVISEFVANGWDADAEKVGIEIDHDKITIEDNGQGMTFEECQKFFLTVGRDRRKDNKKEVSDEKGRPVLGRKGIGKFAGFGIAEKIVVTSISKKTGELTNFEMDIREITEYDALSKPEKPIKVLESTEPNKDNVSNHGTKIELLGIRTSSIDIADFREKLARRFLLPQMHDDFKVFINNRELPNNFASELEFTFPRDLDDEDKEKLFSLEKINENGWAQEKFKDYIIRWRIGFFEEPIETEELRGIAIFAKGKMAQKPFFFDISGGISGQMGLEYITGQVIMDFIDEGENDLIATERQRINLQTELGKEIKKWGIKRIKFLSNLWKQKRSQKRLELLENKLEGFKERLDNLPSTERRTVKSVLLKIAKFERLGQRRFRDWCNDILTSWEKGRLKDLIEKISQEDNVDESRFLELLTEADVLTSLNIAESVKTKILTIAELKEYVEKQELENKVRDHIYKNPWIIHPKWESYRKERSVKNLIKDVGARHLKDDPYNGRVDLALSSGDRLLLIEFMRPGLELDFDHIERLETYVTELRLRMRKMTGATIKHLDNAYIIADTTKDSELVYEKIKDKAEKGIYFLDWNGLIQESLKQWQEYLSILKERHPEEPRIQSL